MGDAADMATEQGLDALLLHETGECDSKDPCQYCAEEERDAEKLERRRKKRTANK
jgi:hypothetical protein